MLTANSLAFQRQCCEVLSPFALTVSVSVWGICPHRTVFFFLILGFSIDIYEDLSLGLDFRSVGEDEDEDENEDVDEKTGDEMWCHFFTYSTTT